MLLQHRPSLALASQIAFFVSFDSLVWRLLIIDNMTR
jgi:hypothetical protein